MADRWQRVLARSIPAEDRAQFDETLYYRELSARKPSFYPQAEVLDFLERYMVHN